MYYLNKDNLIKINDLNNDILILAPSMYWYALKQYPFSNKRKIENISLKSAKSHNKSYDTAFSNRCDDGFESFVFSRSEIEKLLKDSNILIEKIYFASTFSDIEQNVIKVNDDLFLTKLSSSFYETKVCDEKDSLINISNIKLQNKPYYKNVKKENNGLLNTILLVLFLAFIISTFDLVNKYNSKKALNDSVVLSTYKTNSLIKKYERIQKEQEALRNSILSTQNFNSLKCRGIGCEEK